MSTKLHLALGYALHLDAQTLDPKALAYERLEDEDLIDLWRSECLTHAREVHDSLERLLFEGKLDGIPALTDVIVYDAEFGFEKTALLVPGASLKTFKRYGNMLDTYLAEAINPNVYDEGLEPVLWPVESTIYPYVGLMRANPEKPLGIEKFWEPCYRDNPETRHAIPWAPWHLWFLIKHVWQLSDERTTEVFLSLRPSVYSYWS